MIMRNLCRRDLEQGQNKWSIEMAIPGEIIQQLDHFVTSLYELEEENLIGIYLHGSLAMGCFHPQHSDLDLLVFTEEPPTAERRRVWAQLILQASGAPAPIEVSVLNRSQYTPWRHPTPFSFHFSEEWRASITQALGDATWEGWEGNETLDPDLAGHFTVTRHRGVCLAGVPIVSAVPEVPWVDYLDSIVRDFTWACEHADDNPVYLVLNTCRIWAAITDQFVLSKAEGAAWALPRLSADLAAIVTAAATLYSGKPTARQEGPISGRDALVLAGWIGQYIVP
jgi:streptomycin 3"-adenylyltransferase